MRKIAIISPLSEFKQVLTDIFNCDKIMNQS